MEEATSYEEKKRTLDDARETVKQLQQEVLQMQGGQLLSPDEPFLEGLTLGEYLELPEAEQSKLWDKWGEMSLEELVTFFEEDLPNKHWKEAESPAGEESAMILSYKRGKETMEIVIKQMERGAKVEIFTGDS